MTAADLRREEIVGTVIGIELLIRNPISELYVSLVVVDPKALLKILEKPTNF
jgi:hypothetical protein